jgi:hypothetical protein
VSDGCPGDRRALRRIQVLESVLKLLDDLDDLQAFLHVQGRTFVVILVLLVACVAALAGVFMF